MMYGDCRAMEGIDSQIGRANCRPYNWQPGLLLRPLEIPAYQLFRIPRVKQAVRHCWLASAGRQEDGRPGLLLIYSGIGFNEQKLPMLIQADQAPFRQDHRGPAKPVLTPAYPAGRQLDAAQLGVSLQATIDPVDKAIVV